MITDPISDMLTRIRNAQAAGKREVEVPFSSLKFQMGKIMEKEGFVAGASRQERQGRPRLILELKYLGKSPFIRSLKRVSKPGLRVYAKHEALPRVLSDLGIAILSTPSGLMTNKEARARRLGGEVLCEIF